MDTKEIMQADYNKACEGLAAQGFKKAMSKGKANCVYRSPEDPSCRCAIGHLIPDDKYVPEMEGGGIGGLWDGKVKTCIDGKMVVLATPIPPVSEFLKAPLHFYIGLQQCHDLAYPFRRGDKYLSVEQCMKELLVGFGKKYELVIPSCLS